MKSISMVVLAVFFTLQMAAASSARLETGSYARQFTQLDPQAISADIRRYFRDSSAFPQTVQNMVKLLIRIKGVAYVDPTLDQAFVNSVKKLERDDAVQTAIFCYLRGSISSSCFEEQMDKLINKYITHDTEDED